MSGEVSLKGDVGAVGGVGQKIVAAWRRGRTTIILPQDNEADLLLVPREIRDQLQIHLVDDARKAVELALEG